MLRGQGKGIIIVDYLQLVDDPKGSKFESRNVQIGKISRSLKILAKELNVPVIALSQLSRQVENRVGKVPQLSDLRDSGSIEQDADIVMFLDRSADDREANMDGRPAKGIANVIVAKNRMGATGTVEFVFKPEYCRFYVAARNVAR
jgi:replicative DNA helicase